MPIVLKSGSLHLPEPSGSVQACNGIALPFTHYTTLTSFLILSSYLRLGLTQVDSLFLISNKNAICVSQPYEARNVTVRSLSSLCYRLLKGTKHEVTLFADSEDTWP